METVNDSRYGVREKTEQLVADAREADGSDNITLILIDLKEDAHGEL